MKKTILSLTLTSLLAGALFTACNSPKEKVEDAQKNLIEASKDLNKANDEYLADMEKYRKEKEEKIEANTKSILEFNERISKEKKEAREEYTAKIAALEQKNSDLKKKMDDYKADGKESWETFKAEFTHDMDELGKAIVDLQVKNVK